MGPGVRRAQSPGARVPTVRTCNTGPTLRPPFIRPPQFCRRRGRYPIATTCVAKNALLTFVERELGRAPTQKCDSARQSAGGDGGDRRFRRQHPPPGQHQHGHIGADDTCDFHTCFGPAHDLPGAQPACWPARGHPRHRDRRRRPFIRRHGQAPLIPRRRRTTANTRVQTSDRRRRSCRHRDLFEPRPTPRLHVRRDRAGDRHPCDVGGAVVVHE